MILCVSLVEAQTYDLQLIKYNDLDGDGTNNELNTEPGTSPSGNALEGWEFIVYDSTGTEVARNTTGLENPGANGDLGIRATIPDLVSGVTYTICETQQPGWTNTDPGTIDPDYAAPCEDVALSSSTIVTRYFGNVAPDTYDLRLIKYNDLDGDGTNNELNTGAGTSPSGNALEGWEFIVYDSNGTEVARNTTSLENPGANGDLGIRATIPDLISGVTYTICETQQPGWANTEPGTIDPTYGEPCESVTLISSTRIWRYFGNQNVDAPPVAVCPSDASVVDVDNSGNERVDLIDGGSTDDLGIVGYRWLDAQGTQLATGASTSFSFAVGTTTVTLEVIDTAGQTDRCEFDVTVSEPAFFSVGGSVSGLEGNGLVLRNNGSDDLAVGSNGPFFFPTQLLDGSGYFVTVAGQPTGPAQTCLVSNASGMLNGADVDDVAVTCTRDGTDLAITKTDGRETINAGEPLTWVIEVTNNGPLAVQGARVRDILPPAREPLASWECAASPGASCTASGTGSIRELVDLDVGASVVFALTVDVPADFQGLIENEASVAPPAGIIELAPGNNVARDQSFAVLFADGFEASHELPLELLERALLKPERR